MWRRERIAGTGDVPWLTVAHAMVKLEELGEAAHGKQRHRLTKKFARKSGSEVRGGVRDNQFTAA
jgi:hypothetical protein